MAEQPKILIVAPHLDDEVLGCGGSICAHVSAGRSVSVLYLTSGEYASSTANSEKTKSKREAEAKRAMKRLGVPEDALQFLRIGDGKIDGADNKQFLDVMSLLRKKRPNVLYIPHLGEASYDHQQAYRLLMRTADMAQSVNYLYNSDESPWRVPFILAYEVWTPLAIYQYLEYIDEYAQQKVDALLEYHSQSYGTKKQSTYAGPAGLSLSAYRGAMARGGFAEAFEVIRADNLFNGFPHNRCWISS